VGDNDAARLVAAFREPLCNPGCENLVGLAARCREAPFVPAGAFKRAGRNRRDLRFAKPLPPADRNLAQPLIELHLHGALAKAFADEFGRTLRAWLGTGYDRCPQSVRRQAQPPADCPRLPDAALGQR
jgi:hypothetical protein